MGDRRDKEPAGRRDVRAPPRDGRGESGEGGESKGGTKTSPDEVFNKDIDPIQKTEEINIPQAGMRIDRDLYKSFKEEFFKDKQSYNSLKQMIENQNFNDAEEYFKEKYLKKSYSLDRLREALGLDVNISIKDLLLYTFGFISKIKNKDEILEEEFDKFDDKFKPDENVLERYAFNQVGELVFFEVDSLLQREFFRSYLLGNWKMKFMIVDEDTLYNYENSSDIESTQNIYKFTHDSLFVSGWKYEASYRVKYIDSLRIDLNGQWSFDDDSLSTYRTIAVNDKDTLTINSYNEFVWNNFLNTTDKEELVVFVRNQPTP